MKTNGNCVRVMFLSVVLLSVAVHGCDLHSNMICQKHYNYSNTDVVALILARGGSKGIPLKNLAKIGTDTLVGRTLKTILNSKVFADVWLSTDDDKIAEEAMKFNVNVHIRPSRLADDNTTSITSVQEFLAIHRNINNLALVQCTSVFLKEKYLQKAVQLFKKSRVDCVFSVTRTFKLRWAYDKNAEKLLPINFEPQRRPRRQDWNGELIENGMVYVAKRSLLLNGLFQNERCGYVEVDPDDELEIDSPEHLQLANVLLKLRKMKNSK